MKKIGIVGTGTMGVGIAQVCAANGYDVILYDSNQESLKSCVKRVESNLEYGIKKGKIERGEASIALEKLSTVSDITKLKADLIIEAIIENLDIKRKVFSQLEEVNNSDTILATNTSSIPISQIATVLDRKDKFIGIHFFNPAHIMKLVEVISGESTSEQTTKRVYKWVNSIGKTPVNVKDSPGFIVNRVARAFYTESLKANEEGAVSVKGADALMRSAGFRLGPFELMDLIGVDTNLSVTKSMYEQYNQEPRFKPSRVQQQLVDEGRNGKKSGEGFYKY